MVRDPPSGTVRARGPPRTARRRTDRPPAAADAAARPDSADGTTPRPCASGSRHLAMMPNEPRRSRRPQEGNVPSIAAPPRRRLPALSRWASPTGNAPVRRETLGPGSCRAQSRLPAESSVERRSCRAKRTATRQRPDLAAVPRTTRRWRQPRRPCPCARHPASRRRVYQRSGRRSERRGGAPRGEQIPGCDSRRLHRRCARPRASAAWQSHRCRSPSAVAWHDPAPGSSQPPRCRREGGRRSHGIDACADSILWPNGAVRCLTDCEVALM